MVKSSIQLGDLLQTKMFISCIVWNCSSGLKWFPLWIGMELGLEKNAHLHNGVNPRPLSSIHMMYTLYTQMICSYLLLKWLYCGTSSSPQNVFCGDLSSKEMIWSHSHRWCITCPFIICFGRSRLLLLLDWGMGQKMLRLSKSTGTSRYQISAIPIRTCFPCHLWVVVTVGYPSPGYFIRLIQHHLFFSVDPIKLHDFKKIRTQVLIDRNKH